MKQLLYYIIETFKFILPAGLPKVIAVIKPKPLLDQIKQYYLEHGYDWSNDINLMTIRDTSHPNTYNDIHIIKLQGQLTFVWGTSEPGRGWTAAKMNRYKVSWVGLYPVGFYADNFRVGTFHGPALRQVGTVMLMWIKNGNPFKLRKGGGCHFHRRFSKGENVGVSSAGCQVPKSEQGMDTIIDLIKSSKSYKKDKRYLFDYMIADIKNFPILTGQNIQG